MDNGFWTFNVGHLTVMVGILGLAISFWAAHNSNRKTLKDGIAEFQDVKTKVDMMYRWFEVNIIGRR